MGGTVSALCAVSHAILSADGHTNTSVLNAIVVTLMSIQGILLTANAHLDFSKTRAECQTFCNQYSSIQLKLKTVLAEPAPTADDPRKALQDVEKACQQIILTQTVQLPQWAIKAAEKQLAKGA